MSQPTLPLFACHKQVRAAEIRDVDTNGRRISVVIPTLGDEAGLAPVLRTLMVEDSWLEKFSPKSGDWLVEYADGYRSVSPAGAFVGGYSQISEDEANDEWKAREAGDQPDAPEPQDKPSPTSGVSNDGSM